jgi:hypothetical protein
MAKYVEKHKPIIETMINTSALALTSFGVMCITSNSEAIQGYLALLMGMGLEFFKYYGRKIQLW